VNQELMRVEEMRESVTMSTTHQYFHSRVQHRNMQLHFSVTFACCGNVEIVVSTWCEAEVVQILKMIWVRTTGLLTLQVCKSASLQVCKSASLQVCKSASLQSASVAHRRYSSPEYIRQRYQQTNVDVRDRMRLLVKCSDVSPNFFHLEAGEFTGEYLWNLS